MEVFWSPSWNRIYETENREKALAAMEEAADQDFDNLARRAHRLVRRFGGPGLRGESHRRIPISQNIPLLGIIPSADF